MTYAEDPESYRGTGTVFIADYDGDVRGYWDGSPENGNIPIEEMPSGFTRREAAQWGLSRTSRVLIRFEDDGYYAVGAQPQPDAPGGDHRVIGYLTVSALQGH